MNLFVKINPPSQPTSRIFLYLERFLIFLEFFGTILDFLEKFWYFLSLIWSMDYLILFIITIEFSDNNKYVDKWYNSK